MFEFLTRSQQTTASQGSPGSARHGGHPQIRYGTDRIGLVGFHDRGFVIARFAEPFVPWLQERTLQLHARIGGASTNLTDGLRKAVSLLSQAPAGALRRAWLLTDGYPNRETDQLYRVADDARRAYINVNTVGFGDRYDADLLRRISGMTHNGKFVPVSTLQALTDALTLAGRPSGSSRQHRMEFTVFAIDLSGSMLDAMDGKRKIEIMEQAILYLLHYKQQCFA